MSRWGKPIAVAAAVLTSFVIGTAFDEFAVARTAQPQPETRAFELMVYHTRPGKAEALAAVFRDVAKLQTKHGLDVLGYWVPAGGSASTDRFVYLIAHPDRATAEAHWRELHSDPAFPPLRDAAARLIEQKKGEYLVDEIYLRPTDYSAMK